MLYRMSHSLDDYFHVFIHSLYNWYYTRLPAMSHYMLMLHMFITLSLHLSALCFHYFMSIIWMYIMSSLALLTWSVTVLSYMSPDYLRYSFIRSCYMWYYSCSLSPSDYMSGSMLSYYMSVDYLHSYMYLHMYNMYLLLHMFVLLIHPLHLLLYLLMYY